MSKIHPMAGNKYVAAQEPQKTSTAAIAPPKPRHATRAFALSLISTLLVCLVLTSISVLQPSFAPWRPQELVHSLAKYAVAAKKTPLLQVFQVYPPVLAPTADGKARFTTGTESTDVEAPAGEKGGCVVVQELMKHSFANSYNMPFVAQYTPPDCKFNRVLFNMSFVAAGRQFDRLGAVYFGNTELWRFSTAEPTATGIEFGYVNDMSNYLALFKEPQKLIVDLGNEVTDIYTAALNGTLTATFFSSDDTVQPADKIVPVSPRNASMDLASIFQYPEMQAINNLTLPRNIRKAFFTLSATGQIDEEFWFGNVLESEVDTFGPGNLLGYSPFREVQLFIDGMLAGVAWPFPIIFTGGVVPGFWRPIVGIDAFDLREDEIDITPWLPLLCDGKKHSFEIKVAGISDNGHGKGKLGGIGNYWLLTGKIFLWLDKPGSITTGSAITRNTHAPSIQLASAITKTASGKQNKTLTYTVDVQRDLSIFSTVKTSTGATNTSWSQTLRYHNHGHFTQQGNKQVNTQSTNGTDVSSNNYARNIAYPVHVETLYAVNPTTQEFSIDGKLRRAKLLQIAGSPIFPTGLQSFQPYYHSSSSSGNDAPAFQGSSLQTSQNGTAHYQDNANNTVSSGYGTTQQEFVFAGLRVDKEKKPMQQQQQSGSTELYTRRVLGVNGTVVENKETLMGRPFGREVSVPRQSVGGEVGGFAPGRSVRRLIGHGPRGDGGNDNGGS